MNIAARKGPLGQKAPRERHTPLERRYYKWLHTNCSCVLTGYTVFEIAHTGGLAQSKGMGRKSALNTCLPLRPELHRIEERRRADFWEAVLPDHLVWADRLYRAFWAEQDPTSILASIRYHSNADSVEDMMRGQFNWHVE